MEIKRRNGKQVPSAHPGPTGDRDTGTENGTCWTMPPTKTLLGHREGLGPAEVLGCHSSRRAEVGCTSSLAPGCTPRRRRESQGSTKGPQSLGVSALFPSILLLEKPGCIPPECPKIQSPLPEEVMGKIYWWYCLGWGCGKTNYKGMYVASCLVSAQCKFILGVSLSPSGGITTTQNPLEMTVPQPPRVPPAPTMSRDPLPECTMGTGMALKGPRWDRG